jgi:glutamate decarboxylase
MKECNCDLRDGDAKTAVFGSNEMLQPAPVDTIPMEPTTPQIAYQMVKDETFAQTQPRLNLATFVTTYMDDYATKLMNEAISINYIDETEYPRIAVMNAKCINIMANLWNSPEQAKWKTGALAIGSSEACMLGGVAAWLRWKDRRKAQGKPTDKPNFVISSGFQVVWEKFAQLWQIEMRQVPLTLDKTTLDPEEALKMCDENTICIVPIQGVTWTGLNDDVEALDKALDAYNAKTGYDIPIHVDAATGGFILPFLNPDTKWDFRLKWVLSISTSGHKFGLVYPGLGWVVWKDKKYLPDAMSFSVNYLGANITQVGLNFSRPAAQILGQYYQFIRLGFQGYKAIQRRREGCNAHDTRHYAHDTASYACLGRNSRSVKPVACVLIETYGSYHGGDFRGEGFVEHLLVGVRVQSFVGDGGSTDGQLFCSDAHGTLAGVEVERHIGVIVDTVIIFQ